jgi:hypothetical protein
VELVIDVREVHLQMRRSARAGYRWNEKENSPRTDDHLLKVGVKNGLCIEKTIESTHSRVSKRRSLFRCWQVMMATCGSEVVQLLTTPERGITAGGFSQDVAEDQQIFTRQTPSLCRFIPTQPAPPH